MTVAWSSLNTQYLAYIAQLDFNLFPNLTKELSGKHYKNDDVVISDEEEFLKHQEEIFYTSGIQALQNRLQQFVQWIMLKKHWQATPPTQPVFVRLLEKFSHFADIYYTPCREAIWCDHFFWPQIVFVIFVYIFPDLADTTKGRNYKGWWNTSMHVRLVEFTFHNCPFVI